MQESELTLALDKVRDEISRDSEYPWRYSNLNVPVNGRAKYLIFSNLTQPLKMAYGYIEFDLRR